MQGRGINTKLGWKGTVQVVTPGVAGNKASGPGGPQPLLQASFLEPATYTAIFELGVANVLPIQSAAPLWPPMPTGPTGNVPLPGPGVVQPTASSVGVRALATLAWSLEGVTAQRVIDVGSGTTISATASSLAVSVADATYTIGGAANLQYSLSCAVAKGVRPSTTLPPTLWGGTFLLNAGQSMQVPVPQNSGVVSVEVVALDQANPATAPNVEVAHTVSIGLGVTPNKYYAVGAGDFGFVAVNPGTNSITLVNNGADATYVTVTWGISG
jgi:hypothetical protein